MKKLLTLCIVLAMCAFVNTSHAQDRGGPHGDALNVFVGFGETTSVSGYYEFEVHPDITVSPVATIWFGDYDGFALGVRGDYYFDRLLKLHEAWDIFAGVDTNVNFDGGDFNIQGHVGAEFLITNKFGIVAETGFGSINSISVGLGVHF